MSDVISQSFNETLTCDDDVKLNLSTVRPSELFYFAKYLPLYSHLIMHFRLFIFDECGVAIFLLVRTSPPRPHMVMSYVRFLSSHVT